MRAERLLHIAVFARAPVPGQVKTRLIPELGADGAARLQRTLIDAALVRARALPDARVSLWSTAPEDDSMQAIAREHGVALHIQQGTDLGERMAHAFASTLDGSNAMLLIGTDCPAQTVADLRAASDALLHSDAVLQPAEDGGYVLIGLRRPCPELFVDIAWGTQQVLAATRLRARSARLRMTELACSWDLDRPADLERAVALGLITRGEAR
jgi:rSAM/selenodomain-associated transferase 1